MNVSVIGAGHVGLVTAACFAELRINVICMDIDSQKIDSLKKGAMPIYEPRLSELVLKNSSGRLNFTANIKEAVERSDIIFIAVNTPTLENGRIDLSEIFKTAKDIALFMNGYKIIVNKSTVPVFTGKRIKNIIKKALDEQGKSINFDVVSNPEFLQEGSAVDNFLNPDRIVIGYESEKALEHMKTLYNMQIGRGTPLICTNIETAEMIKYASNAFLATKISFINEIANICELCGADVVTVARAMGLDERIGSKFLQPGPGFGGSCLPKDAKALLEMGRKLGYKLKIAASVLDVNERQKKLAYLKIKSSLKRLKGKCVAVLGLSFKPGTDDIRDSPSIEIIKLLTKNNAVVNVYDPKAMDATKKSFQELKINYFEDTYSACAGCDCIVLATEWNEFKNLDFAKLSGLVRTPVFIDLKNVYEPAYVKGFGFKYKGVGRE